MKKALYRHKSLPSVEMSRKRRERGGKPLTKKIEKVEMVWINFRKASRFGYIRQLKKERENV